MPLHRNREGADEMPKYLMVVPSSAQEGRDDDYNAWYDNQHIHDICALPGVTSGKRYDALPAVSFNPPPGKYLAIYEIETDDVGAVLAELGRRAQSGEIAQSDTVDMNTAQIWIYQQH
jgi:hypothetical protein